MPGTLHIIEPSLVKDSGHFPSLVRAMVRAARPSFSDIQVWAHHDVSVEVAGARVMPYFRRKVRRMLVGWMGLSLLKRDCTLLFSTAQLSDFVGVHNAMRLVRAPKARVVLFVHMYYHKPARDRHLRRMAALHPEFVLVAPTESCAQELRGLGFARVHVAPYPHAEEGVRATTNNGPAHVLMPGVPRVDKGLAAIADYADLLARRGEGLRLRVQVTGDHWGKLDDDVAPLVERLRGCAYAGLELVDAHPDPSAYAAQFAGAIVLQPYDRELFRERISGVTLDALRAGCPVIVTSGTWMSRLVERHGAGVVLGDHSPDAIDAAMRRVLADLPRFRAAAAAAGEAIRDEQEASPLVRLLVGEPAAAGR